VESWEAVGLAQPRRGHFDLGTGYHGDVWLELDALLLRPAVLRQLVRWMADRLREHAVDAVCGPVEGGAFLAYAVADLLTAAFLPGYRTPGETAGYHLPPVPGEIAGWRVGIVDDAVNAGTAVAACAAAVRPHGAVPVAVTSLLALGDASEAIPERLGVPFYPAATLPSRTWPAAQCELCAKAIPLSPVRGRRGGQGPTGWSGGGGVVRGRGGVRGPRGRRRCGRGHRCGGRCCRCAL
jgi:orotate phosphoribosyltransferase